MHYTLGYASLNVIMRKMARDPPNLIANDMWAMGNVLMYMLTLEEMFTKPTSELPDEQERPAAVADQQIFSVEQHISWVRPCKTDVAAQPRPVNFTASRQSHVDLTNPGSLPKDLFAMCYSLTVLRLQVL